MKQVIFSFILGLGMLSMLQAGSTCSNQNSHCQNKTCQCKEGQCTECTNGQCQNCTKCNPSQPSSNDNGDINQKMLSMDESSNNDKSMDDQNQPVDDSNSTSNDPSSEG